MLSTHIIRTSSTIEPIGMAYAFNAFIGKNNPEFYEKMLAIINNHVRYMNGRDLLNIVRSLVLSDISADTLFTKWLYPLILQKKKMCSATQLEEYLQLLSKRNDFTSEKKKLLEEALQYKIERKRILSLIGTPLAKTEKRKEKNEESGENNEESGGNIEENGKKVEEIKN